jgi:hypothetical protein
VKELFLRRFQPIGIGKKFLTKSVDIDEEGKRIIFGRRNYFSGMKKKKKAVERPKKKQEEEQALFFCDVPVCIDNLGHKERLQFADHLEKLIDQDKIMCEVHSFLVSFTDEINEELPQWLKIIESENERLNKKHPGYVPRGYEKLVYQSLEFGGARLRFFKAFEDDFSKLEKVRHSNHSKFMSALKKGLTNKMILPIIKDGELEITFKSACINYYEEGRKLKSTFDKLKKEFAKLKPN